MAMMIHQHRPHSLFLLPLMLMTLGLALLPLSLAASSSSLSHSSSSSSFAGGTMLRAPSHNNKRFLANKSLGHLQSGPDKQGSSFVSSSFVDQASERLHIVGTTYGKWFTHDGTSNTEAASGADDPACFYAVVQLPTVTGNTNNKKQHMDWIHSEILGMPSVEEGCRSLMLDIAEKRAFVVGHSDTNGLLGDLFDSGSVSAQDVRLMGQILDYRYESQSGPTPEKPLQLQGGRVLQNSAVSYPAAVAGLPGAGVIYVASMLSSSPDPNNSWEDGEQLDPSEVMKYGSSYYMTIRLFETDTSSSSNKSDGLKKSVKPGISRSYATDGGEEVHVSALLQLPDRLLVAGHTAGVGTGFASTGQDVDAFNSDGFVTQLDLTSLNPMQPVPTYRVTSGRDDYVTAICKQTDDSVFVVGYSKGHVGNPNLTDQSPDVLRGYVSKLDLEGMTSEGAIEFEAYGVGGQGQATVKAVACALSRDGLHLYVVGTVEDDGYMKKDSDINQSFGGTDVWIAQLNAKPGSDTEGQINWVKQLGSEEEDKAVGVQVDEDGNAVLIGNTKGQVYRSRGKKEHENYADVFLATFSKSDGKFVLPLDHDDFVSLPPKATAPPTEAPAPVPAPSPPSNSNSIIPDEATSGEGTWIFMLILLFLVVIAVVCFIVFWNCYHIPKREIATDRSKVLEYLQDFDVEDVELKHSATGGWHCSYVNDLAQGVNRQTQDDYSSSYRDRFGRDDGSSSYDPLNAGSGHSLTGSRRSSTGSRHTRRERFSDEADDDEVISFGTARKSRRSHHSHKKHRHRHSSDGSSHSHRHRHSSDGSVGSSSRPRINRAKDRWEHREVI